jgi:hypothetical protein
VRAGGGALLVGNDAGVAVIVEPGERKRCVDEVPGQALPGLVVVWANGLALIYGKAGMTPRKQDLDQARGDLILRQQRIQELATKQQHDLNRIGAWDGEKRAFRRNQSIRNQGVKMGMEAGGIVAIGLQGSDHAGEPSAVHGGILEKLLNGRIKALAQNAEKLAVVFETEAEHLGDGHDILTNGPIAQIVSIDMFGKQQGALLVA